LATKKISALTELTTPAGTEELIVNAGGTSKKIQIDNLPSSLDDNSVTLAKMAGGTDGNLITYDASGDPAYVTTGTSGQVLTSGGAGVAPTFQTAASGGKVLQVGFSSTTSQISTTSTSQVSSGLDHTLTLQGSGSSILVMLNGGTANQDVSNEILKVALSKNINGAGWVDIYTNFGRHQIRDHGESQSMCFKLNATASAGQTEGFRIYFSSVNGDNVYLNSWSTLLSLTVWEISS